MRALLLSAALLAAGAAAATPMLPTQGPPQRVSACIVANDDVTRMRLGKDRTGKPFPVDLVGAVARGDQVRGQCSGDGAFMLAYSLARIDLSGDPKRGGTPAERKVIYNAGLADLEGLRSQVLAGRSDRYEIFNILALIYTSTGQPARAAAVTQSAKPFLSRMSAESRQKTLVNQGVAQAQLGQSAPAVQSFNLARQAGSKSATAVKAKMIF